MPRHNSVQIAGHLVRDAEFMKTNSGTALCKFTVAVNSGTKDREDVAFIDCETWKKTAEIASGLEKGDGVIVFGKLKQDKWQDKEGNNRSKIGVVAWDVYKSARIDGRTDTTQDPRQGSLEPPGGFQAPQAGSQAPNEDDNVPF